MLQDRTRTETASDDFTLVVLFAMFAVVFLVWVLSRIRRHFTKVDGTTQTSVLLAHYTQGLSLLLMNEGKRGDLRYSAFLTAHSTFTSQRDPAMAKPGAVIYRVELPFHTEAHILGVSKKFAAASVHLARYAAEQKMEEVKLEGEFTDVFTLYVARGQQTQARYVFDPLAMEHVLEYCQTHLWEIVGDELYFVVDGAVGTKGSVLAGTEAFVKQIRPALVSRLPGHHLPHNTPYGRYRGEPMKCPLCKRALIEHACWFECPRHHGRLVSGQHLLVFRNGKLPVTPMKRENPLHHEALTCPYCQHKMMPTDYQNTGIIIDSCTKCHYRWLDAGELKQIVL